MKLRHWFERSGWITILLCCGAQPAVAAEFVWSGEYRLRAESIERSLQGRRVQWDFLQRVRLGATANLAPQVAAHVQLQDSRLWGAEGSTVTDLRNLDLHQGYVDLTLPAASGLRLRLGRQELSYGVERLVGAVGFSNVSRSFDALQVRWQRGRLVADALVARAADATAIAAGNDDIFLTYDRWTNAAADRGIETYVLHRTSPGARFETTLGERLFAGRGDFHFEEEFAYQLGRRSGKDLRAFLLATQFKWQGPARNALGVGFDWLSGDDPLNGNDEFFDTGRIFHTGHKFYGKLDIAENLAGQAGLLDPYAMVQVAGPGALQVRFDAHRLFVHRSEVMQAAGPLPARAGDSALGTELDLTLQIPWQAARFEALAAVLFPGPRLDGVGLDRIAWFGHFTTQVTF